MKHKIGKTYSLSLPNDNILSDIVVFIFMKDDIVFGVDVELPVLVPLDV